MDFKGKIKGIEKPALIPGLSFTPINPKESANKLGAKWSTMILLCEEEILSRGGLHKLDFGIGDNYSMKLTEALFSKTN